jgi:uncharacterized protein
MNDDRLTRPAQATRPRVEIPTDEQIRALHVRNAPTREAFDLVYTHCRIVCAVAEQIIASQSWAPSIEAPNVGAPDVALVRAGALLHDIGVYRLYDSSGRLDYKNYIRHGVLGHDLLREAGFPEVICRFCSCHTGVGLSREDIHAQNLPVPIGDYLAESVEEELVMYADKFHSKSTPPVFLTSAAYAKKVRRFGPDKEKHFAGMVERWGEPELGALAEKYGHTVV